jgi:glycerol-3-phosphate cytidylyltransferase-like family protein
MKTLIVIVFILFSSKASSQSDSAEAITKEFFKVNNLALNVLEPPKGYNIFYNCDSMLFVRGDFSDTIKIWTPSSEWNQTLQQFLKIVGEPNYGKTVFAKSILSDGRISVVTYSETVFVYRNDSLYEVDDTVSLPTLYTDMIVDLVLGKIDENVIKRKKDSIDLLYKDRHAYVPKLIYVKGMFQNGKKKVKLSSKFNYEKDEIELEQEWTEDGKKCYLVRINNRFEKQKTTYAYAINEDMKFVWWEGCNVQVPK